MPGIGKLISWLRRLMRAAKGDEYMPARVATIDDAETVISIAATIGQLWSMKRAAELLTGLDYLVVVDDVGGLFWVAHDTPDPTLVRGGYCIAANDAQAIALYRAALIEAISRWPMADTLESRIRPDSCQPDAVRRATVIARMEEVGTEPDGTVVFRVNKNVLVAVLQT